MVHSEVQEYKYIKIEIDESTGIGKIILSRPPLNILNIEMMEELNTALAGFQHHSTSEPLKVIVIAASGKAFSAGVDIADHTEDKVHEMLAVFHKIFENLRSLEIPTVAMVQGAALGGGCEIAACCDMLLASDKATFGQPEIKVGVFPPVAAVVFPKLIGLKKAYELLMTGEVISAQEAHRLGLVNAVFPAEDFEARADKFVKDIAKNSAVVLRITKRSINDSLDLEFPHALEKLEDLYLNTLMRTADAHEGLAAFLEKRAPVWKNK
jgi:cyclohexa-1,5-dienecarbonyl-CoA hydratase